MQSVLVIGASGEQGRAQVDALLAAGYSVRAMSRAALDLSFPQTVVRVQGDLLDPASLPAALEQVDTVFLNLPSASFNAPERILEGFNNFLSAARSVRPQRIIFNASLYVGDQPSGHVAHDNRYQIIHSLLTSGLPATAVCPVIFMENVLQGWALPALLQRQVLCYPHADKLPVSWISLNDVARIMICLAGSESGIGKKLVIGGPQQLLGEETAAALGRAWEREIVFESRPVADFAQAMAALFAPENPTSQARIERDLGRVYSWYNEREPSPFTVDMTGFLAEHPITLTTMEQWARANNPFTADGEGVPPA